MRAPHHDSAAARRVCVEGFAFDVVHRRAVRRVQIMAAGGVVGAAWICSLNAPDARTTPEAAAAVLLRVECELARSRGFVPEFRAITAGTHEIVRLHGATVIACRPILSPVAGSR